MERIKHKSKMKHYYEKVGIPTARYYMVKTLAGCRAFIKKVGFPVVVKPDNGVGAAATYKLKSDEDLVAFFDSYPKEVPYIMEEFVNAEGNPIFETGNVTVDSIMDIVNNQDNSIYYIVKDLPDDTRAAGRATVKSFGVKSRFVHFEFFRLTEDQDGLGKKGDVVALEVNMRPCGGFSPDMMNFANSTNVYKIWADMIAFNSTLYPEGEHYYCAFAGRRDGKDFILSHEELLDKYAASMKMVERIPDALAGAMGNQMYVATFSTKEEMDAFYKDAVGCR